MPTGNLGDILAGYFAKRMPPSAKLAIATNANDILHRFWQSGKYKKKHSTARMPQAGCRKTVPRPMETV